MRTQWDEKVAKALKKKKIGLVVKDKKGFHL